MIGSRPVQTKEMKSVCTAVSPPVPGQMCIWRNRHREHKGCIPAPGDLHPMGNKCGHVPNTPPGHLRRSPGQNCHRRGRRRGTWRRQSVAFVSQDPWCLPLSSPQGHPLFSLPYMKHPEIDPQNDSKNVILNAKLILASSHGMSWVNYDKH